MLPDEPGGYHGFQALFGAKYVDPEIGAGAANVTSQGVPVTDSAGYLTDEFGNQINGAYSDCSSQPSALGSGSQCYLDQARYYNDAFGVFFQRLAADGITPKNTLFVLSSDEGDHEAGANVGRALAPTPAGCDGVTVPCTYTSPDFGEIDVNATGLLSSETGDTTPFSMEDDTAPEFYLAGNPGPSTPVARTFSRDVARLTASNPYSGNQQETIANYLANPVEEGILHFVDADAARTPTLAMFAKPDHYLQSSALTGSCTGGSCARTTPMPGITAIMPPRSTPTTSVSPGLAAGSSAWTDRPPARDRTRPDPTAARPWSRTTTSPVRGSTRPTSGRR